MQKTKKTKRIMHKLKNAFLTVTVVVALYFFLYAVAAIDKPADTSLSVMFAGLGSLAYLLLFFYANGLFDEEGEE
jgi:hypothetical protein